MTRQKITLLAIFSLFFGPLILVILMQSPFWKYQPAAFKNNGLLVEPPVEILLQNPDQEEGGKVEYSPAIDGKWVLVYVVNSSCDIDCEKDITALRQIHRAAGKKRQHLEVAIVIGADANTQLVSRLVAIYSKFHIFTDNNLKTIPVFEKINQNLANENTETNSIQTYIIDPLHNVVLAYQTGTNPSEINKDLKQLLKWSRQERKT